MYYRYSFSELSEKKKYARIAWKCGSQFVIHITKHYNGVNELSDHFTRV